MAALTRAGGSESMTPPRPNRRPRSLPVWRWIILAVTAVYFLLPLWGALLFPCISAFRGVISES